MMTNRQVIVLVVVALFIGFAWLFRYDETRVENGLYMVDRWTGKVYIVSPSGKREASDINRPLDPDQVKRIDAFLDAK